MRKAVEFLKSSRSAEVAMMLGFPATGLLFSFTELKQLLSADVLIFMVATFALSSAIYAFNAWAGADEDSANDRLADLSGRKQFFLRSMILFILVFIGLYALLSILQVILSITSFLLWTVYSYPKKGFKYRPGLGTLIHFAGQVIHFIMGFAVLGRPDMSSVLISFYFALLFCAGHLNHELIDYDADKSAGIDTGAVHFGKRNWEIVSSVIFSFSTLYILTISVLRITDMMTVIPFICAGMIHMAHRIFIFKNDISAQRFISERRIYRFIYFFAGLGFIMIKGITLLY